MIEKIALIESPNLTCDALVVGCSDCAAEQVYLDSIGHDCRRVRDNRFHTMCEVRGEARRNSEQFHRLSHEPERCERCDRPINDRLGMNNTVQRVCPANQCVFVDCKFCGYSTSSFGPVDCPYCGSLGRHPRITRMRRLYQVKRRHW